MRVLMIGDVVGRPGRRILRERLGAIRTAHRIDFVVANGENAAGGAGITPRTFGNLRNAGVDVVTTGNHVYRRREVLALFESGEERLLRPANYSKRSLGRGMGVYDLAGGWRVGVLNLQGRVYMPPSEDPFEAADEALEAAKDACDVVLVDFHGEATSEKEAMGYHLDGRVAAVVGTHTHVPTADATVLPRGTAYVTDLGMTGPHDSCLGVRKGIILKKFRTGMPARFDVAEGDCRIQGVVVDVEESTGRARSIERFEEVEAPGDAVSPDQAGSPGEAGG